MSGEAGIVTLYKRHFDLIAVQISAPYDLCSAHRTAAESATNPSGAGLHRPNGYLARKGIKVTALKKGLNAGMDGIKGSVRDTLGLTEPTMMERFANWITGRDTSLQGRMQAQASNIGSGVGGVFDSIRNTIPGMHKTAPVVPEGIVGSIKHKLVDGVDSIRSHLPGAAEAEAARARAYAATHASTLDNIKTSAEYLKNRVVVRTHTNRRSTAR